MPKYIDIHAHTNFKAFDEDRDAVILRALLNDTWVINAGTQIDTSRKAVEIANKYEEGVYAIVGLHPIHTGASYHDEKELGVGGAEFTPPEAGFTSRGEVFDKDKYRELLNNPKVVGIGECGLDYYRLDEDSIEKQKKAFIEQIEIANEFNKPLVLHIRNNPAEKTHNAYFDVYELLKKYAKIKSISHFFAGSVEDMKRFIEIGVYISFAGPITYKPKLEICDYYKVIQETPLEMIMTDTDSPYVAPVPYRGKRNEPSFVSEIVKKIAEIKELPDSVVAEAIVKNTRRVFDI
jgi:TatD DNase family protein